MPFCWMACCAGTSAYLAINLPTASSHDSSSVQAIHTEATRRLGRTAPKLRGRPFENSATKNREPLQAPRPAYCLLSVLSSFTPLPLSPADTQESTSSIPNIFFFLAATALYQVISSSHLLLPFLRPFVPAQAKDVLVRCAGTALNSKLISSQKDLFAPMVVEAVSNLDQQLLALSLVSGVSFVCCSAFRHRCGSLAAAERALECLISGGNDFGCLLPQNGISF